MDMIEGELMANFCFFHGFVFGGWMLRFHHNASWAHIFLPDEICNALSRLYNAWYK